MKAAGKEWLKTWQREAPRFRRIEDFGGLLFEANDAAALFRRHLLSVCPAATKDMFADVVTELLGDFPAENSGLFKDSG